MNTKEKKEIITKAVEEIHNSVCDMEEILADVDLKVEKARTILRLIIQNYGFDNSQPSHVDKLCIGENMQTIYTLMESADDFLFEIAESLKGVLA